MIHPTSFLLKSIVEHRTNGLNSLGNLNAAFIEDISKVMEDFASQTAIEYTERLLKGEEIQVGGKTYAIKKIKSKERK